MIRLLALSVLLAWLAADAPAAAQTPPPASDAKDEFVFEGFPKDIAARLAGHYGKMRNITTRGIYSSPYLWPLTMKSINVCFLDGTPAERKKVVEIARGWTQIGAHMPLDFGADSEAPRSCTGQGGAEHIRIVLKPTGMVWSAVGKQSISEKLFPASGPSMSLGFASVTSSTKRKRSIIHEFGHALGLQHEHQSRKLDCWAKHYEQKLLAQYVLEQFNWSEDDIKAQLRVMYEEGLVETKPDSNSVMLYGFPARFYKARENSPCYSAENAAISQDDAALMRRIYPVAAIEQIRAVDARKKSSDEMRKKADVVSRSLSMSFDDVEMFLRPD